MAAAEDELPHEVREDIRRQARAVLEEAGAWGTLPTPIPDVMGAAEVVLADDDLADEGLLAELLRKGRKAGGKIRRALEKVCGVFDAIAGVVYIDRALPAAKLPFLKLHEVGHAFLPWQRGLYAVTEDCKQTLSPEVAEQFDAEANVFATEVLFQNDTFAEEAADHDTGVLVPVRLSRKYGASIYATVRQYVFKHRRACAVLVLNPPEPCETHGFVCSKRRVVVSPSFAEQFGHLRWAETYTPDDEIGKAVPVDGKKMSGRRTIVLTDRNGRRARCVMEAFTQGYQIFILIHSAQTLARASVSLIGCDREPRRQLV